MANDNSQYYGLAGGLAGYGVGQAMADYKNPYDSANKYYDQIPGQQHQAYDPWINYGQQLTQHPGERLNEIGQGYHQSPGFQFALQQALQGSGHGAAAGGMAGSPQHEQQNMGIATNLANQDYNQWLQNALGLHNTGYQYGQQAGLQLGDNLSSNSAQRAKLAMERQNAENQHSGGIWGSLLGGAGTAAGMFFGGPAGAAAGGAAGSAIGRQFS
jgi:hypothetical protein